MPSLALPDRPVLYQRLLACGLLSTLVYALNDLLAGLQYPGYDFAGQTISELSAIGAPTRPLLLWLGLGYTLLAIGFSVAVVATAGDDPRLRRLGALLAVYGSLGLLWPFAPMNPRGAEFAPTDAVHIGLAAASVLLFVLTLLAGARAFGARFRAYTLITLAVSLGFGLATALQAPRVAAGLPTPWIGVTERINIYSYMVWLAVLSVMLWRRGAGARQGSLGPDIATRRRSLAGFGAGQ